MKAFGPPVLGWHQLGWANGERSNGRDSLLSACSDLLRGGRWRLKALDAGAGEMKTDNDRISNGAQTGIPSSTPHRYLVAARVAIDHNAVDPPLVCAAPTLDVRAVYHMAAEECFYHGCDLHGVDPMCG